MTDVSYFTSVLVLRAIIREICAVDTCSESWEPSGAHQAAVTETPDRETSNVTLLRLKKQGEKNATLAFQSLSRLALSHFYMAPRGNNRHANSR